MQSLTIKIRFFPDNPNLLRQYPTALDVGVSNK